MTTATIREVQHNLAGVLRSVEAGEEVIIRRRNHSIAKLVPIRSTEAGQKVDWSSLSAWRTRVFVRGKLPGKAVSELISDGRGDR